MNIKRYRLFLSLILLLLMSLQLCACGRTVDPQNINEQTAEGEEPISTNEIQTNEINEMRVDLTSLEIVKLMGNGINLGNTMEAYGHKTLGTSADVSKYETLWGQPVTTKEMISGMKAAGFDTLRIPVAWTNTMNFESGDYTIREDYLDRVEEIINYALN